MSTSLRATVEACWAAQEPAHERVFQDAVAANPDDPYACEGAALVAFRRGDMRTCYRMAARAAEAGGGSANYLYGMAAAALHRTDEAIGALLRAHQSMPDHLDIVVRLGGMLRSQNEARAMQFFFDSLAANLNLSDYRAMVAIADEALKYWPEDPLLGYLKALALFNNDASQAATTVAVVDICKAILDTHPDMAEARHLMGRAMNCQARYGEAVDVLVQAADERPDNGDYQYHAGALAFQIERFPEAEKYLKRSLELDPTREDAKGYLNSLPHAAKPTPSRKRVFGRFPQRVAEFADLEKIIRTDLIRDIAVPQPLLTPKSKVLALGSCFATNMARVLQGLGVTAESIGLTEYVNSTFANRLFMEWLAGDVAVDEANVAVLMKVLSTTSREAVAQWFRSADVMIYTLGVAPCFFDSETGAFKLAEDSQWVSRGGSGLTFRTTTVDENVDNLRAIVNIAKRLNPNLACVFSVSPVPLKATFERHSAITADCLSKSVLRVAVEQFLADKPANSYYWPSFEIFRWVGGYTPEPLFGTEDGAASHVSEAAVSLVMRVFIDLFGDDALRASSGNK
jgi:tetratricopeptide (TPR) repeat protein